MPKPQKPNLSRTDVDYDDYTWVGTIVNVHGLQGELKVKHQTDNPDYYLEIDCFFIEQDEKLVPFEVERLRLHKNLWIVKLSTIDDRNQAEGYRKLRVLFKDSWLKPLEEGEFFYHDLINCEVEDLDGKKLGFVVDIMETGANDVYIIANDNKEFLLPSTPDIVKEIDIKNKLIRIDPVPGLIE